MHTQNRIRMIESMDKTEKGCTIAKQMQSGFVRTPCGNDPNASQCSGCIHWEGPINDQLYTDPPGRRGGWHTTPSIKKYPLSVMGD